MAPSPLVLNQCVGWPEGPEDPGQSAGFLNCSVFAEWNQIILANFSFLVFSVCLSVVHGEMVQRILYILHFLWAIILAMVDGLTLWLNLLTKQYRETSAVLCNERYFIIHKIQQVNSSQQVTTFGANPLIEHKPVSALPGSVPHQPSQQMGKFLKTARVPQWMLSWMKLKRKNQQVTGKFGTSLYEDFFVVCDLSFPVICL